MKLLVGPSALLVCTVCWSAEPSSTVSSVETDVTAPSASAPSRTVSPALAARLTEKLPKFTPKPGANETSTAPTTATAGRDVPRNAILRLPKYEVREKPIPQFKDSDLLTPKGRLELALKRHPGLKLGPFAFLNNAVGLAMLEEERAAERGREKAELEGRMQEYDQLRAAEDSSTPPKAVKK
jgi:hypothetical protein